ncbi:MAG: hypothetical protein DRJ51_01205 [Thermoprotei archaeon]|nr:MAG: hypothetical protein DRJ51_01205 [Thermoprotei archaeon]
MLAISEIDVKKFLEELYDKGPILREKLSQEYYSALEEGIKRNLIATRKETLGELIFLTYKGLRQIAEERGEKVDIDVEREVSNLTKTEAKILIRLLEGFKPIRRLLEEIGTRKYTALYKLEKKGFIRAYKNTRRARNYRVVVLTLRGLAVAEALKK